MNLKSSPDKLYSPEYYMEIESYDVRLSVMKINDFFETLMDSTISIIYSDKKEHKASTDKEVTLVRRIHTRHAVIDLNNCFDLLLQIPWFYYRIWESYNKGGDLDNTRFTYNLYGKTQNKTFSEKDIIIRNRSNWVRRAEKKCEYSKILHFLEKQGDKDIFEWKEALQKFANNYVFKQHSKSDISIRSIANQIKHNSSLKIKELQEPWNSNVSKIKGKSKIIHGNISEPKLFSINAEFKDDLYIDLKYEPGETFRGKDYVKPESIYSLDDLYIELVNYREAIIDLYNDLYKLIEPNLMLNPLLKSVKLKKGTPINLDKYFKETNPQ